MLHQLKILPCHFAQVANGNKTFEVRDNSDRGFQAGDFVSLHEYDVDDGRITGQFVYANITYVTNFAQKENWVVFGFTVIHADEPTENLLPDPEGSFADLHATIHEINKTSEETS